MEVKKRCTNCGYYPFCERIEKATSYCDFWLKRERSLKLENKDGLNFKFKEV